MRAYLTGPSRTGGFGTSAGVAIAGGDRGQWHPEAPAQAQARPCAPHRRRRRPAHVGPSQAGGAMTGRQHHSLSHQGALEGQRYGYAQPGLSRAPRTRGAAESPGSASGSRLSRKSISPATVTTWFIAAAPKRNLVRRDQILLSVIGRGSGGLAASSWQRRAEAGRSSRARALRPRAAWPSSGSPRGCMPVAGADARAAVRDAHQPPAISSTSLLDHLLRCALPSSSCL